MDQLFERFITYSNQLASAVEPLISFYAQDAAVPTYIDNNISGTAEVRVTREGHSCSSQGGCLRGNLMGKHVDFSTRTVITGDPNFE